MTTTDYLKQQLAILPEEDRAELAHFLLVSLGEAPEADAAAAWDFELNRRATEITSGSLVGNKAAAVLARIRERLG